ncbi:MAG: NAD-dependent epimerase/dehydratase family protein [Planctomycetota bacterium]|nr:NAD-dependent epimerase/dehydratase family protein [Planctomycetota bacterium]
MPRAVVTGATGFIGGAVSRELTARGWEVHIIHRPGSDLRHLDGLVDCERHVGDLRERDGLASVLEGCDVLFHVAARYEFGLARARDIYLDNVVGTRNVVEAARASGVKKVVYTSTVGVLWPRADGVPVDETQLARLDQLHGAYKRSKWQAEQEVLKGLELGLPAVIVCPTAPVGPYDVKPTPTGKMVLDFLRGRMRGYVDTGLNLVASEDVAVGHILAAEKGTVGKRYILGHENLSLKEIFDMLSNITGIPSPRFKFPRSVLWPLSLVSEGLALLTRRPPNIPLETIGMARRFMYFDCSRAREKLGYRPRSVEEALRRAVRWFEDNGYVPLARKTPTRGADSSPGSRWKNTPS